MRISLIGQGPFGEKVLERLVQKGEDVVGVFSPPDKRGDAMKDLAEKSGIFSHSPVSMKDLQVYSIYKKLQPEVAVLAFVTDIVPEKLLSVPSLGTICYHPSLLPRHRGASAINWAIIQGDTRTGLTIFWVDKGIDTGPILLQKEVAIGPEDTTGSLYFNRLFPMGVDAVLEAIELIKQGSAPRIPQDEMRATYEPPCDDRVASVDFGSSVRDVYNLIRGCDPQPGAYVLHKGKKIRFYEAKFFSSGVEKQSGEIVSIGQGALGIAVRGGLITVAKLRIEKGEKMGPLAFAEATGMKIGDRFAD